jgi:uncharacterized protein (DUF433 family)
MRDTRKQLIWPTQLGGRQMDLVLIWSLKREGIMTMRKAIGRFVVVDSKICHGQPTFRGTRILVKDVLEQVGQGMTWKTIEKQWRGAVSQAAIAEAVQLANQALLDKLSEVVVTSATS